MKRDRKFWYSFFSELGFMIMPYAYNNQSNTLWECESVSIGQEIQYPDSEGFKIVKTDNCFFFYHLDEIMLNKALDTMRYSDFVIRRKLQKRRIVLNNKAPKSKNIIRFQKYPLLNGLDPKAFFAMIAHVTNELDPLNRRNSSDYFQDYDTYGFFVLDIEKR